MRLSLPLILSVSHSLSLPLPVVDTSVSTCRVLGLSCCPQQGELPVKPVLSVRHDPLVATATIARLRAKAEKETRIYKEQSDHARVSTSNDHTPDISEFINLENKCF